ncbi:MAG: 3-phosphoshikimate 1-carboxyvinyltransferase [Bacteroidales bacterium]
MDIKIITPENMVGTVNLPASKSISNRALIINALSVSAEGDSLSNVARCDDTDVMLKALASEEDIINIGAAGTAMRFLTAFYAMNSGCNVILDGSERMRQRPISILVNALRSLGADIEYGTSEGYPPIAISGKELMGGEIKLAGDVSSQYISALMMIAPLLKGGLRIVLEGRIISIPYIQMTISLMRQFGAKAQLDGNIITIEQGVYSIGQFTVESDWSAASYWYQLVSLIPNSTVKLPRLTKDSVQGDSRVEEYFSALGVETIYTADAVIIRDKIDYQLPAILTLNLVDQPDLAQTIIVTAALKGIPFNISGLSTLKIKETDRIEALRTELYKLGFIIDVTDDFSMVWDGNKTDIDTMQPIEIATYDDHRMAMAFAGAAVKFTNIVIKDCEVVTKSYPKFWSNLMDMGFKIEEKE